MKTPSLHAAFAGILLAAVVPAALQAQQDYTLSLTGNVHWNTAPWSPSGNPGAQDNITNISGTSSYYLYLSGHREINSITKVSNGNIRIANSSAGSSVPGSYSLTVHDTITVRQAESGGLLFRSIGDDYWLSVTTENLSAGGYDPVTGAQRGTVLIGETLDYSRVNFTVNGQTRLEGYGNISIGGAGLNADAEIDLGHLSFAHSMEASYVKTGVVADPDRPHTVAIKSIHSDIDNDGVGSISGGGILKVGTDAADAAAPAGGANFVGLISETLKLVKTGDGVQKFSRANGNTYSGGTLISEGVLSIHNTSGSGLGTGGVTVAAGGTLAGSGIVALGDGERVVVETGGLLAPSADGGGVQTLVFSGMNTGDAPILELQEGSGVTFHLDSPGSHDRIALRYYTTGDLLLDGDVVINLTGTLQEGIYELFSFRSEGSGSALVQSGLEGGLIMGSGFDGYTATFHYDEEGYGGVGVISMELTAIPEPANVALLVLGGGVALLGMQRAGRRKGVRAK